MMDIYRFGLDAVDLTPYERGLEARLDASQRARRFLQASLVWSNAAWALALFLAVIWLRCPTC